MIVSHPKIGGTLEARRLRVRGMPPEHPELRRAAVGGAGKAEGCQGHAAGGARVTDATGKGQGQAMSGSRPCTKCQWPMRDGVCPRADQHIAKPRRRHSTGIRERVLPGMTRYEALAGMRRAIPERLWQERVTRKQRRRSK